MLITNAKKVETGLDLVMFNHVIFYELDYSLFTMWQAMRRVWRLGQTKAVTVTIPVHMDAMEAHALSIMANKFQAALLLYGEMGAGLAQEADVQDVMAELAQHILGGQQLSANGIDSLMAASIENELEGAQATETILTPEQLAELFAQLAENEEEERRRDRGERRGLRRRRLRDHRRHHHDHADRRHRPAGPPDLRRAAGPAHAAAAAHGADQHNAGDTCTPARRPARTGAGAAP